MSHLEEPVTQCHACIQAPTREAVVQKWGRIRMVYAPGQIDTKADDDVKVARAINADLWEIHFVGHPDTVKHALELAEGKAP